MKMVIWVLVMWRSWTLIFFYVVAGLEWSTYHLYPATKLYIIFEINQSTMHFYNFVVRMILQPYTCPPQSPGSFIYMQCQKLYQHDVNGDRLSYNKRNIATSFSPLNLQKKKNSKNLFISDSYNYTHQMVGSLVMIAMTRY